MADFVIVTPDIVGPVKNGGIGTACFHYARTLANAGWSVDIMFTGPLDTNDLTRWVENYRARGIGFLTLHAIAQSPVPLYGARWYSERSLSLMQFFRHRDDRCILFQDWHANGFWAMRAKRLGTAFTKTRLGVIAHSPTEWQNTGMQTFGAHPLEASDLAWTERSAIAEADFLVSPSRHMVSWLRQEEFSLPRKIELCPYTFEDEVHPRAPKPDLSHLIFFGRIETRKGLHILADALRDMQPALRPARVSLLGKYGLVLERSAADYLAELRAELPEIAFAVYSDFDYAAAVSFIRRENGLIVMPSLLDNLPLTIIEAIANGFHFLASDVGGIPELADPDVLFQPTAASLKVKLEQRYAIAFDRLHHLYSPEQARQTWLRVASELAEPIPASVSAPSINVPRHGVSICVPFYRHDRYMPRLINSLLKAATPDTQLVLVNDGTPEADCPLFHDLARRLTPLGHVFHTQDNAGAGVARNTAVTLARHERVIFFDSDNVARPELVSALSASLSASGADIVCAPFIAVPPMLHEPTLADALYRYHPPGGSLAMSLFHNLFGDACCITTRRVVEAAGGFQQERMYCEDWEFFLQAAGRGFTHVVHTDPLFYYTFEDNERRKQGGGYMDRTLLWSRLETMDHDVAIGLLRTMIHHTLVLLPP